MPPSKTQDQKPLSADTVVPICFSCLGYLHGAIPRSFPCIYLVSTQRCAFCSSLTGSGMHYSNLPFKLQARYAAKT